MSISMDVALTVVLIGALTVSTDALAQPKMRRHNSSKGFNRNARMLCPDGHTRTSSFQQNGESGIQAHWKGPLQYANPFFVHKTHVFGAASRNDWIGQQSDEIEALQKAKHVPRNVAFVFPNNKKETPLVQKAYDKLGIPYYITARTYKRWDWWGKIIPLKNAIMDGNITERYIVFTDAQDIMPHRSDFSGLKKAFKSYNASVVVGGYGGNKHDDHGCWASSRSNLVDGEKACAFARHRYPWSHKSVAQAGFIMGKKESLLKYLQELEYEFSACKSFDDQAAWQILHMRRYPDIKIDAMNLLMSRVDAAGNLE